MCFSVSQLLFVRVVADFRGRGVAGAESWHQITGTGTAWFPPLQFVRVVATFVRNGFIVSQLHFARLVAISDAERDKTCMDILWTFELCILARVVATCVRMYLVTILRRSRVGDDLAIFPHR